MSDDIDGKRLIGLMIVALLPFYIIIGIALTYHEGFLHAILLLGLATLALIGVVLWAWFLVTYLFKI